MAKMVEAAAVLAKVVEESIAERNNPDRKRERYIYPSSLSRGCMLYIFRELTGMPKAKFDPRVSRILQVGTDGHRRIPRYFKKITLARETFFVDEEYRIRGYCDALIYVPPTLDPEQAGFYAVEIKTASSTVFERILDEDQPKEDHALQCQIYMWGLTRYYGCISMRGGIIFYENRDTLEHHLFNIEYDEAAMTELLAKVKIMLERMKEGLPPEDYLPLDHWAHGYCGYLDICEPGQQAIEYQKKHRQPLPDKVLAGIIGKRIMRKQRREGAQAKRSKGPRSLDELATQLNWK